MRKRGHRKPPSESAPTMPLEEAKEVLKKMSMTSTARFTPRERAAIIAVGLALLQGDVDRETAHELLRVAEQAVKN